MRGWADPPNPGTNKSGERCLGRWTWTPEKATENIWNVLGSHRNNDNAVFKSKDAIMSLSLKKINLIPEFYFLLGEIQRLYLTFNGSRLWMDIFSPNISKKFDHSPSSCSLHWILEVSLCSFLYSLISQGLQTYNFLSMKYCKVTIQFLFYFQVLILVSFLQEAFL